jgi:hypothetical protein
MRRRVRVTPDPSAPPDVPVASPLYPRIVGSMTSSLSASAVFKNLG